MFIGNAGAPRKRRQPRNNKKLRFHPRKWLSRATQAGRHRYADRGLDFYETPACATEALLRAEPLPHGIFEPVMRSAGTR